jgi:voltage-gated potassium channel
VAIEDVLNESAAEARRRFEIPVLVAALLVVPVIFIEDQADSLAWLSGAAVANWLIWLAFTAEYVTVLSLADRRWAYTKKAWLDVFIIVSSFPLLPGLLASTRLLRLLRLGRVLRLLRLVRLTAVITRGVSATRTIFAKRGLGYIIVVTLLVGMGIGGAFAVLEGSALSDGFWWAIVTITTVGYGDFFPVTLGGRIAAAVLMLLGIGLLAVITASVAAHFFEDDHEDAARLADDVARLHERLDVIEQLLRAETTTSESESGG